GRSGRGCRRWVCAVWCVRRRRRTARWGARRRWVGTGSRALRRPRASGGCLGKTWVGSAGRRGFPDSRAATTRGHRVPVPPAPQGRAVHAVGPTARPVRGRAWARAVGRSVRGRPGRRGRRRGGCGAWGVRRSRGAKAASLPSGRRVVAAVAGGERLTEVGSVGGEGVHRSKPFAPGVEV